jgi:Reverse transcriptase (RNA-dependent DNA polymerase)
LGDGKPSSTVYTPAQPSACALAINKRRRQLDVAPMLHLSTRMIGQPGEQHPRVGHWPAIREISRHSYGFRPGRSAHQAVAQAQQYIAAGYGWAIDLDLEKFFDRVNHDKPMGYLAKRIEDKRLLKLPQSATPWHYP